MASRIPEVMTRPAPSPSTSTSATTVETRSYWELNPLRTQSCSSVSTTEHSTSEATLCESQGWLKEILDIQSNVTLPANKTYAKLDRMHCPSKASSSYAKSLPLSPIANLPMNSSPLPPAFDMDFTIPTSWLSEDVQRCRAQQSPLCLADEAKAEVKASNGLGLLPDTMSHPPVPAPPTATYSGRLRRLAPPPLQLALSPHQSILSAMRPSVSRFAQAYFTDVPLSPEAGSQLSTPQPGTASLSAVRNSTVPTPIDYPEEPLSTSLPLEILQWSRRVSRALDTPRSPLSSFVSDAQFAVAPSILPLSQQVQASTRDSPLSAHFQNSPLNEFEVHPDSSRTTPGASRPPASEPPPLQRPPHLSLPPVPYDNVPMEEDRLSPLCPNFREALTIDGFLLRIEKCAEAADDAALSLCSCSLLKDPEAIRAVCQSVRRSLGTIHKALDECPEHLGLDDLETQQYWFTRHWRIISSLDRNLKVFYLFADLVRRHPPRIHRLADHVDKLHAYEAKFIDLARRLSVRF
ncbi:hypothetical protein AcV7_001892 [Taiwanofungus camphoratus]|nr:hypothetical protein AcV7_001892 [Antrodia cinnamomea]